MSHHMIFFFIPASSLEWEKEAHEKFKEAKVSKKKDKHQQASLKENVFRQVFVLISEMIHCIWF